MDEKEYLREALIDPDMLIDTIEGEKPLWFILDRHHQSKLAEMPSGLKPNVFLRKKGLNCDFKLKGSDYKGTLLELLNEFKSLQQKK